MAFSDDKHETRSKRAAGLKAIKPTHASPLTNRQLQPYSTNYSIEPVK
jgi:hypothetical protein